MDFAAVAASVVSVAAPFVSIGAEAFAKQAGEAAAGKAGDLLAVLRKRWTGDREAEAGLELFQRHPKRYASAVADIVRANLEVDPAFAAEVRTLLDDLGPKIRVIQKIKVAEHVTGVRVESLKSGEVDVTQEVDEAKDLTGFDGKTIG